MLNKVQLKTSSLFVLPGCLRLVLKQAIPWKKNEEIKLSKRKTHFPMQDGGQMLLMPVYKKQQQLMAGLFMNHIE